MLSTYIRSIRSLEKGKGWGNVKQMRIFTNISALENEKKEKENNTSQRQ